MAKTKLYTISMALYGGMRSKWHLRRLHARCLQACGAKRLGAEIWRTPPNNFTKGGLLQLSG